MADKHASEACARKGVRVQLSPLAQNGFLGSHLADRLLKDGYKVIGCDNLIGGYLDNVPPGVKFFSYDCGDREAMVKIMEGVDIVYHCACTAYEGLSVFSPHLITKNTYGIAT